MLFIPVCCVFSAVCRDTTDSCVFILCPETLPSSIQALFCSVSTQTIRPPANRNGLVSSFSVCMSLCLSFVCPGVPTPGIVVMRVQGPPCRPPPQRHTWRVGGGFCGCPLSDQGSFPLVPLPEGPGPPPLPAPFPQHPPPSPSRGLPTISLPGPSPRCPVSGQSRPGRAGPEGHDLH